MNYQQQNNNQQQRYPIKQGMTKMKSKALTAWKDLGIKMGLIKYRINPKTGKSFPVIPRKDTPEYEKLNKAWQELKKKGY